MLPINSPCLLFSQSPCLASILLIENSFVTQSRRADRCTCCCDAEEIVRIQTGPADQCTVDVRLGEQLTGVARLYAAAVQNSDLCGGLIIVSLSEQPAKISVDLGSLLRRGDFSRADCPNRFIGDDGFRNVVR